jgi:outer membrane protein OmpA-like peptidoglycan-associated protein
MKQLTLITLFFLYAPSLMKAQVEINKPTLTNSFGLEGIVKNKNNDNPLPATVISIYDDKMNQLIGTATTDDNGHYAISLPIKERYRMEAKKSTYFKGQRILTHAEMTDKQDFALENKPGYILDVTVFDKAQNKDPMNSLRDCKVEIYNNTTKEQELTIASNPKSVFNFPFVEGNHYTILVRKPGYINRRVEAYVNVNGCILCMDGMGIREPDVVALMTHNNELGYLLGNIDLDTIAIGKKFVIPNIYYDFDKSYIRADAAKVLDKLSTFLKDNPAVKVELGAHTDVRGSDTYNLSLSDRRAASAVQYLVDVMGISPANITSKGYGETELINYCSNGVNCPEAEHQKNRRTEIKITGISSEDPLWNRTLKEIIEDKDLYRKIIKLEKIGQPSTGVMR